MCAPLAQVDRASGYEPEGRMFESCRAHHKIPQKTAPRSPAHMHETERETESILIRHFPIVEEP